MQELMGTGNILKNYLMILYNVKNNFFINIVS